MKGVPAGPAPISHRTAAGWPFGRFRMDLAVITGRLRALGIHLVPPIGGRVVP
jgi:hypothetical protein